MARQSIELFGDRGFGVVHDFDPRPDLITFPLHCHENLCEIVLLIEGDCEFEVEGNSYKLRPGDIVYTRPYEMHHIVCLSQKNYERIILYITPEYFEKRNIERFFDVFKDREPGVGNLAVANPEDSGLYDCLMRLYRYAEEEALDIADNTVTEFLYLLNKEKDRPADFYTKNERVREIIVYINSHLAEDLSLDKLSERFYISRNYMSRIFKKCTGHTVREYVTSKRVALAAELHRKGMPYTHACYEAGFQSYVGFYKAQKRIAMKKEI